MHKLSSTSALVLLWARDGCYKSRNANDYLNLLDLTSGNELYKECLKIWQFYDEVILNRKFGVLNLIKKSLLDLSNMTQMIIAGAGLDALGIEVLEYFPNLKVFELDIESMEAKSEYVAKVGTISQHNISFINTDLQNRAEVSDKLRANGWNSKEETLLVMEGISYYLTPESIKGLIEVIKPKRMVFEFLKEKEHISFEQSIIADKVFNLISNLCGCTEIVRYNYSKIENIFDRVILTKQSMKQLELERTGANRFFINENSGWIDVCLLGANNFK